MMWFTVIANVIQLVSAAVEFVSNTLKRRRTTIKLQIVSRVLDTTSDFLLQGFSGMVVDAADAIRNILNYRDQLTPRRQFLLVMATVALIPFVNNLGIIGLLPLLSTVFFTCTARTRDPYKFKLINALNFLPWVVYDFTIDAYVSMAGDIFSIILCVVAAIRIKRREDKVEKRKARKRELMREKRRREREQKRREERLQRISAKLATLKSSKRKRRSNRSPKRTTPLKANKRITSLKANKRRGRAQKRAKL